MEKKINNNNTENLQELLELTASALIFARQKNIEGVGLLLDKRKKLIREMQSFQSATVNAGYTRRLVKQVLQKDLMIKMFLQRMAEEVEEDRSSCRKIKKLRQRFNGARTFESKFIDRKI